MRISLTYDNGGASEMFRSLTAPNLDARTSKVMAEAYYDAIQDWIKGGNSFTSRHGHLEDSIKWRPEGDGAVVFATMEYAPYVEFGTGIHGPHKQAFEIKPKPGRKALSWKKDGVQITRRKVISQGQEADPYFFADQDNRERLMLNAAYTLWADTAAGR